MARSSIRLEIGMVRSPLATLLLQYTYARIKVNDPGVNDYSNGQQRAMPCWSKWTDLLGLGRKFLAAE